MTDLPDETLWIDRRLPAALLAISAGFCVAGLFMEPQLSVAFVTTGVIFVALSLPVFWIKIAFLRSDHVQLGKRRIPYSEIVQVGHESQIVKDLAARVNGRNSRQQDHVLLTLRGNEMAERVPVGLYRDGASGLAAKIMERVAPPTGGDTPRRGARFTTVQT